MRQRLTLVGEQENDIAALSLGFAQFEPQADTIDLARDLVRTCRSIEQISRELYT